LRSFNIIILLLIFPFLLEAQNIYIKNYAYKDYGSLDISISPQNWDIIEDEFGRIFIANTSGIMVFDGTYWYAVDGSENKDIFDLGRDSSDVIYVGGASEMGYITYDPSGKAIYKSLLNYLPEEYEDFSRIDEIATINDHVYFKSKKYLFHYHDSIFTRHEIESENPTLWEMDQKLYLQKGKNEILVFENGQSESFISDMEDNISSLKGLIENESGELIYISKKSGFYKLKGSKLLHFETEVESKIDNLDVLSVCQINSDLIVLATKGAGLVFTDSKGKLVKQINLNNGLASNICYSVYLDKSGGIWTGRDNGFSRVEFPSPLSQYNHKNGLEGIVLDVLSDEHMLYAGTITGLYGKSQTDDTQFQLISGISEVWDIQKINNSIFIASRSGIFQLIGGKAKLIASVEARVIYPSSRTDIIWIGLRYGFGQLRLINGKWVWKGPIKGIDHQVRTIAQENDSTIWLSFEKISRLTFDQSLNDIVENISFDESYGISDDLWLIESYNINDKVVFGTPLGIYRYYDVLKKFLPDSTYGLMFAENGREAFALAADKQQNLWLTSYKKNGKLAPQTNGTYVWDTLSLARIIDTDVWKIVAEDNGKVWLCTTDGLFRYDQNVKQDISQSYKALISKISLKRDSITFFNKSKLEFIKPGDIRYSEIDHDINDISFYFTATSYHTDDQLNYNYWLEGYDKSWSGWMQESLKDFTNLPPGKYIFHVKARNLYSLESEEALYAFEILPPWYRTWWGYGVLGIILLSLIFAVDRLQRRRLYKKQQAKILIQQKELEQQKIITKKLRNLDKLKDEFLANTSHELRTPLNGVIGISESLYDQVDKMNPGEMQHNLSMIIASGKRLASMVDSILDYSKLKTKNLDLRTKPIDLYPITEIVLTMSRPLISSQSINLVNKVPHDIPYVAGDENRIQQILYNLVGNAIKFTETGSITIEAKQLDQMIEISVTDTGIGISDDKKERIFDSFEQVDVDIELEYVGTGLGLAITKELVELHGGKIWVDSKPNVGSSFHFTLPESEVKHEKIITAHAEELEIVDEKKYINVNDGTEYNILIVDDEPVNRQVLLNFLKNKSYRYALASGGKEALEILDKQKIDLILLDIMIQTMSGFEVCRKIREKYLISELPVIFITAKDQIKDLVEGLSYGGNDYITKPFSKDELLARIQTHLDLHSINDSYSRFIPFEFLHSLGRESIIDVHLGDQTEKEVTILFIDIRDYTTLSEEMTPSENFNFLNSFLSKMGPIIRDNKGFIMQFLGDGLMALFLEDHIDAINASVGMMRRVNEYNDSRETKKRKPIKVGIGLHTGPLILGILGDDVRMDVNVVSDSVNTASRMEGLTKHYGASIIVSENTLSKIKDQETFQYRLLGLVKAKGKSKPVRIYEILDEIISSSNQWKINTKEEFEIGLNNYFSKNFVEAAANFKNVIDKNSEDRTAELYLKLSAKHMVDGVSEIWDGIEIMDLK